MSLSEILLRWIEWSGLALLLLIMWILVFFVITTLICQFKRLITQIVKNQNTNNGNRKDE